MRCRIGRHEYVGERDVISRRNGTCPFAACGVVAYFEPKRDEEEGFDIETAVRHANYLGGGGVGF